MNSEERDVIAGIFKRLEQAAGQPRDAEADRFIAERLREQPYAPYAMAQLIYVQEEAIKSLNQQLEQAKSQAQSQPSGGGGFLSSIFGGGSQARPAAPQGGQPGAWGNQQPPGYQQGYAPQQQPGGPWGGQPGYGQPQAPQGRGFLGSALTTAAGVAGGMVVGSALMNAFSGGHSSLGALTSPAQAAGGDTSDFGNALWGGDQGNAGGSDAGFQDASFDDADLGDGGSDDWV
jgi:uncharacterized protein